MQGNQVFRHAVVNISEAVTAAALDAGIEVSSVDWFVPHQANLRILQGVARRLGIDEAKVITTLDRHANTSAASIPLALDQGVRDGHNARSDAAFGRPWRRAHLAPAFFAYRLVYPPNCA